MFPSFPTYLLLFITLLLSRYQVVISSYTSKTERVLQVTQCDRSPSGGARGDFRNLVTKITLPKPGINEVEVELIYDVDIRGGNLNSIDLAILETNFGELVPNSVTASASDVDGPIFSDFSIRNRGGLIEADMCFGRKLNEDFSVHFKYRVRNMICELNGDHVIISSWFSLLTDIFTEHAEIDYSLLLGEEGFGDSLTPRFSPGSNRAISAREQREDEEFFTVFIPYNPSDLGFGDQEPTDSFLKIGNRFYNNLAECQTLEDSSNLLIYVIAAIPALSCCCLCVLGISQFIMDRQDMQRRRNFRWFTRFNLFQTNNDIVLAPENDGPNRQDTVRAVPESQLTGATTSFDVNISHYIQDGDDALRGSL